MTAAQFVFALVRRRGTTPSPNGTTVTTVGPAITDASGNQFTLTSGGQVAFNGTTQSYTSSATTIEYLNGVVWWENASGQWYSFLVSGGTASNSPIGPVSSPSGTTAMRTWNAVDFLGANTHLGSSGVSSANLTYITNALTYTGIYHIRDAGPNPSAFNTLAGSIPGLKINFAFDYYSTVSAWLTDAQTVEAAYPGTIAYTEGPNEVDNQPGYTYGGKTQYAAANQAQQDLWNAVQGSSVLNTHTKVFAWPCAFVSNSSTQGNLAAYANYGNLHDYYYPQGTTTQPMGPQIASEITQEQTNVVPGQPVVSTETGVSTAYLDSSGFGVDYATQAILHFCNMLDHMSNSNSLRIYFYELVDDSPDSGNNIRENQYGMFDSAGNPKPAATMIKNFTSLLADNGATAKTFSPGAIPYRVSNLPSSGGSYVFQNSSGVYFLAVWQEPNVWNASSHSAVSVTPVSVTVNFASQHTSLAVYDLISSATAINTSSNAASVTVSLGANPLIVKISG